MPINNRRMIIDGILNPLRLIARTRIAPMAALLGGFVLLFGSQLHAQDLLLKEYIYLDGRLLAVERQLVTLTAQQPANDSGKATKMEFALCPHPENRGLTLPDSNGETGISGIYITPEMWALHSPVLARFLSPGNGQSRFASGENFTQQYGAYRWRWRTLGTLEHGSGGDDDGL